MTISTSMAWSLNTIPTPVIPGYGSAIFLHIWKKPGSPTAGCVAASEENILKILGWLKPDADPVIVLNPGRN